METPAARAVASSVTEVVRKREVEPDVVARPEPEHESPGSPVERPLVRHHVGRPPLALLGSRAPKTPAVIDGGTAVAAPCSAVPRVEPHAVVATPTVAVVIPASPLQAAATLGVHRVGRVGLPIRRTATVAPSGAPVPTEVAAPTDLTEMGWRARPQPVVVIG